MKLKGIIITVIILLIIVGIGVGVYLLGTNIGTDLKQEELLREEISVLSSMDPSTDDYNTPIKTTGIYAEVETTIKEYLASYADSTKKASELMNQMQENNLLTNENYKEDGPEFTASFEKINTLRNEFNSEMDTLINLSSIETINKKGEEKNWDNYYLDLYKACMLDSQIETELKEAKEQLEQAKSTINQALAQQEKILSYLKDQKAHWQISENGRLEFDTQESLDGYAALLPTTEEQE